ncbi:MAG: hypothetical protein ACI9BD_001240, partial [Candidatus Marinamargulisbacteria bacterium]
MKTSNKMAVCVNALFKAAPDLVKTIFIGGNE